MANKDQMKTSPGAREKVFRTNLQCQEGKEHFRTMKIVLIIYTKYITFTAL